MIVTIQSSAQTLPLFFKPPLPNLGTLVCCSILFCLVLYNCLCIFPTLRTACSSNARSVFLLIFRSLHYLVHTRLLIKKMSLVQSLCFFRQGNWGLEFILGFVEFQMFETLRPECPTGSWVLVWDKHVDLKGIHLEKKVEEMRTSSKLGERKKKSILWYVYFWRQKKKRLSGAVTQEVEGDPREEGVLGSKHRSSVMWRRQAEPKEDLRKGDWNWRVQAGLVASHPSTSK